MSKFNFAVEKKSFQDQNAQNHEFSVFKLNDLSLSEEDAQDFFSYCDSISCQLIIWTLKAEDILTDEDEVYNEEYLALLRKLFIEGQNHAQKIAFYPEYDGLDFEKVTAAMKHTARRLKKFDSVIGFVLPENEDFKEENKNKFFQDELLQKHEHYIFLR
ncbi:MAG: hypothetical protein K5839_06785 [Treponemataceae bacterium]|nr:hypothetical protein [Treponemataceae bacterium]